MFQPDVPLAGPRNFAHPSQILELRPSQRESFEFSNLCSFSSGFVFYTGRYVFFMSDTMRLISKLEIAKPWAIISAVHAEAEYIIIGTHDGFVHVLGDFKDFTSSSNYSVSIPYEVRHNASVQPFVTLTQVREHTVPDTVLDSDNSSEESANNASVRRSQVTQRTSIKARVLSMIDNSIMSLAQHPNHTNVLAICGASNTVWLFCLDKRRVIAKCHGLDPFPQVRDMLVESMKKQLLEACSCCLTKDRYIDLVEDCERLFKGEPAGKALAARRLRAKKVLDDYLSTERPVCATCLNTFLRYYRQYLVRSCYGENDDTLASIASLSASVNPPPQQAIDDSIHCWGRDALIPPYLMKYEIDREWFTGTSFYTILSATWLTRSANKQPLSLDSADVLHLLVAGESYDVAVFSIPSALVAFASTNEIILSVAPNMRLATHLQDYGMVDELRYSRDVRNGYIEGAAEKIASRVSASLSYYKTIRLNNAPFSTVICSGDLDATGDLCCVIDVTQSFLQDTRSTNSDSPGHILSASQETHVEGDETYFVAYKSALYGSRVIRISGLPRPVIRLSSFAGYVIPPSLARFCLHNPDTGKPTTYAQYLGIAEVLAFITKAIETHCGVPESSLAVVKKKSAATKTVDAFDSYVSKLVLFFTAHLCMPNKCNTPSVKKTLRTTSIQCVVSFPEYPPMFRVFIDKSGVSKAVNPFVAGSFPSCEAGLYLLQPQALNFLVDVNMYGQILFYDLDGVASRPSPSGQGIKKLHGPDLIAQARAALEYCDTAKPAVSESAEPETKSKASLAERERSSLSAATRGAIRFCAYLGRVRKLVASVDAVGLALFDVGDLEELLSR